MHRWLLVALAIAFFFGVFMVESSMVPLASLASVVSILVAVSAFSIHRRIIEKRILLCVHSYEATPRELARVLSAGYGTIYTALHRLEGRGLVRVCRVGHDQDGKIRCYIATDAGRAAV